MYFRFDDFFENKKLISNIILIVEDRKLYLNKEVILNLKIN